MSVVCGCMQSFLGLKRHKRLNVVVDHSRLRATAGNSVFLPLFLFLLTLRFVPGTNGKGKCNEKDNEAGIDSETKKDLQGHVSGNNSKDSKNQEGSDPDPLCSHDNSASGNHSGPAASSNRSGAEDGSQGGDLDEVESGLPVPPTQKGTGTLGHFIAASCLVEDHYQHCGWNSELSVLTYCCYIPM